VLLKLAVLAVWDKLVSGCISLRTGKFTGNSPFSGPPLRVRYAANPQFSSTYQAPESLHLQTEQGLILSIRELVFREQA
jgi:hypothetical protein